MDVLASLAERLPEGAVSTHPGELTSRSRDSWPLAMLREARGERLPRPMAVVFPRSTEDVAATLAWATETGTAVVPRGAGSGVCGGAQAVWRGVVLDLSFMNRVLSVDRESLAVEVEAGARGDRVEAALNRDGLTLGPYPRSMAISSVGGWIASRSAVQAAVGGGTIDDLVLGMVVVLAGGEVVTLRAVPRSAAGPDLRRLLVGSEGTLGVLTRATLPMAPLPDGYRWRAFRPPAFAEGIDLVRRIVQAGSGPPVVGLHDEVHAAETFGALGHKDGPALLLGFADDGSVEAAERLVERAGSEAGAVPLPETYGDHWWEHRGDAAELSRRIMGEERMLGPGVVVDTAEVAGLWTGLPALYAAVRKALAEHAARPVACRLAHPSRWGASLSFTVLLHGEDDQAVERRYVECWRDAARACHEAGGTISHHHGVGILKAPFLEEELGAAGVGALRAIKRALDPHGVLNPGKLLPPEA
ncbi:MAG: FAD-binding oxidoreductase [Actinomycetota bacterium]